MIGEKATRVAEALRQRRDFGFEVVRFDAATSYRQTLADVISTMRTNYDVHRVIVATSERRGNLPIDQLLGLRLNGIQVEADGARSGTGARQDQHK